MGVLALVAFVFQSGYEPLHLLTETHHGISDVAHIPLLAAFESDEHGEGDHRAPHEPHSSVDHALASVVVPASAVPAIERAQFVATESFPAINSRSGGLAHLERHFQPRAPPLETPRQPRAPPAA